MNTNCNENTCNHELCKDLGSNTCGKPIYIQNYHCCRGSDSGDSSSGWGRIMLTQDLEIYVRKDGNDANDGLTDNANGAFLTINAAIRSLMRFNAQGYSIKVVVHGGIYTEDVVFDQHLGNIGYNTLTLMGYAGETVNVMQNITSMVISVQGAKSIFIEGVIITVNKNNAAFQNCINVFWGGIVACKNCTFTSSIPNTHAAYVALGTLECSGNTTINLSNAAHAFVAYTRALIVLCGTIHNQNTSISNTYACALNGYMQINAAFTGSVTGKRYIAILNGTINTEGRGTNYIPGTVAGTVETGGVYA